METALSFATLVYNYLAWCRKHRAPRTVAWYEGHLSGFLAHLAAADSLPVAELKPYHLVEWVDSHETWGDTYKRGGIVAVQRALNWAVQMGYSAANPVQRVCKPPARRRDNPMLPADFQAILGLLREGDPFRDFFQFLWHTGCRPQEARHVEPRHVQIVQERILIPRDEAKGKRHPRVIYLAGSALQIVARLLAEQRGGKLFRNSRAAAWTKYAVCNRMYRLSRAAGKPMSAYDARHGLGTRKLVQGHDHLTVAEFMGHRDGTMLAKVYGHLDRNVDHLKRALAEAVKRLPALLTEADQKEAMKAAGTEGTSKIMPIQK